MKPFDVMEPMHVCTRLQHVFVAGVDGVLLLQLLHVTHESNFD